VRNSWFDKYWKLEGYVIVRNASVEPAQAATPQAIAITTPPLSIIRSIGKSWHYQLEHCERRTTL
jgi:hypothetical protein